MLSLRDPSPSPVVPTPDHQVALGVLLEGLPDAAVGAGPDGLIVFVNGLAVSQFGYRRDELVGRPIEVLWPERLRARYRRNFQLYFELEHPLRFSDKAFGLRKDGSEFIGEMSWGIVETDKGPMLLAIGRDVSERLENEARLLRQSQQQGAVAELGERALRGVGPSELSEEAAERVAATLEVERVAVADAGGELTVWGHVIESRSRPSASRRPETSRPIASSMGPLSVSTIPQLISPMNSLPSLRSPKALSEKRSGCSSSK